MKLTATFTLVSTDGEPNGARAYEVRCGDDTYRLAKEFYAQGASMFEWILYTESEMLAFNTRRAGVEHVENIVNGRT